MAGLVFRLRKRGNMATIEEDNIKLFKLEDDDSDDEEDEGHPNQDSSSLLEETHYSPPRAPSPVEKIKKRLRPKITPTKKLLFWWVTSIVLGLIAFLLALVPLVLEAEQLRECVDFENVKGYANYEEYPYLFEETVDGKFALCRRGEPVLEGVLGTGHTPMREIRVDVYEHSSGTVLKLTRTNPHCLRVEWSGLSSRDAPIQDCYSLGNDHWYGMYETKNQTWPINGAEIDKTPFLPSDYLSGSTEFGSVLHPLWLSSRGTGIHVDKGVQLYFQMNSTTFCLLAEPYELECVPKASDSIHLNYTVCNFDTIAETAKYFLNESGLIPRPQAMPNENLFSSPIWSTWAEAKTNINDDFLTGFYNNIVSNNFNISQLEIDDGYSDHYGDLAFNKDISVGTLSTLSQQVPLTAWVHPFINHNADDFGNALLESRFLPGFSRDESNSVSLVKWWQGHGAVIDFINANTSQWQSQRLEEFVTNNHLTSLKFDAGEFTYLPHCVYIHGLNNNPAVFTQSYVEFVANQSYSSRAEVRVGYFTQEHSILVRLLDRNSVWGTDNGLKSVLNAVLSLGLAGYGFILPDMVGGNGATASDLSSTELPSIGLFTRWLQLNTFFPFGQFSIGPWRYNNNELMNHVRDMMSLHTSLSNDYFIPLASHVINWGNPIIRPLWWLGTAERQDSPIWTIDDQFLIGNELLVAPVLEEGARKRSVYFPVGTSWVPVKPDSAVAVCQPHKCSGGTTVDFDVGIYDVLYFKKV